MTDLPRRLQPMLAVSARDPFDAPDKLFELKWDGIRVIAAVDGSDVRMLSRSGRDVAGQYPEVSGALRAAVPAGGGVMLDGELIALDQDGRPSFPLVMQRIHRAAGPGPGAAPPAAAVSFQAFDILYQDYVPVLGSPLHERKERLAEAVRPADTVHLPHFEVANGIAFFQGVRRLGLEGMVAKGLDSLYHPGRRSREWVKVKTSRTADLVVGGYTLGYGRRAAVFGSLLVGVYDDAGALQYVGSVGGGFSEASLASVNELLRSLDRPGRPFDTEPAVDRPMSWCDPRAVVRVRFSELTEARQLRFPVFEAVRPGVDPRDCTMQALEEASTGPVA